MAFSFPMNILSWNIRGLKNPHKVRNLSKKIKRQNPTIVFLQETKCSTNRIEEVSKKIWKGSESMEIDTRGFAGGLEIIWDPTQVYLGGFQGRICLLSAKFKVIGFQVEGMMLEELVD